MIYIDENSQKIDIPKLSFDSPTKMKVVDILRNKTTDILLDSSKVVISKYLYSINIQDWEFRFENGSQYEFYVYNESSLLTSGIIQCGEFNNNLITTYNVEEKNYKQYNI